MCTECCSQNASEFYALPQSREIFSYPQLKIIEIGRIKLTNSMPLESIKDKVDGNECDLSLNDLTAVPVKELVCNRNIAR